MFRRFRNYQQIGGKRGGIPADCVEVEYLESTGTQYIDTGLNIGRGYTSDIKTSGSYGGGEANSVNEYEGYFYANRPYLRNGTSNSVSGNVLDDIEGVRIVYDGHTVYFYDVGGKLSSSRVLGDDKWTKDEVVQHFILFGLIRGSSITKSICKFWYAKISRYGKQLLDLVPVRRTTDGLGYMCDILTGTLYGNVGTGAFVIGPDKS